MLRIRKLLLFLGFIIVLLTGRELILHFERVSPRPTEWLLIAALFIFYGVRMVRDFRLKKERDAQTLKQSRAEKPPLFYMAVICRRANNEEGTEGVTQDGLFKNYRAASTYLLEMGFTPFHRSSILKNHAHLYFELHTEGGESFEGFISEYGVIY